MKIETLIERLCSDKKVSEKTYYSHIDQLVGKKFRYYDMDVECDCVFKYVQYTHYFDGFVIDDSATDMFNKLSEEMGSKLKQEYGKRSFPWFKAIFILKLLNKEDFTKFDGDEYIYANSHDIAHSEELKRLDERYKSITQQELDEVDWVCNSCWKHFGKRLPELATYHEDICWVCGSMESCTQPRDFGYLTKK